MVATWKSLFPMGGDSRLSAIESSTHARVKPDSLKNGFLRDHVDSLSSSLVRKKHRSWTPRPEPRPQAAMARSRRPCNVLAESEVETCKVKHRSLASWARLSNGPDSAAPGPRPNRRPRPCRKSTGICRRRLRVGPQRRHECPRVDAGRCPTENLVFCSGTTHLNRLLTPQFVERSRITSN